MSADPLSVYRCSRDLISKHFPRLNGNPTPRARVEACRKRSICIGDHPERRRLWRRRTDHYRRSARMGGRRFRLRHDRRLPRPRAHLGGSVRRTTQGLALALDQAGQTGLNIAGAGRINCSPASAERLPQAPFQRGRFLADTWPQSRSGPSLRRGVSMRLRSRAARSSSFMAATA
jgi:hypothetical protein